MTPNFDEKILLIEDDLDDQLIARMAINRTKRNVDLYIANDTLEALQYLTQQAEQNSLPSMILLDLFLPDKSGLNFLQAIEEIQHEKVKEIPIYIVSADITNESLKQIKTMQSVQGFIAKPLFYEKLECLFAP